MGTTRCATFKTRLPRSWLGLCTPLLRIETSRIWNSPMAEKFRMEAQSMNRQIHIPLETNWKKVLLGLQIRLGRSWMKLAQRPLLRNRNQLRMNAEYPNEMLRVNVDTRCCEKAFLCRRG